MFNNIDHALLKKECLGVVLAGGLSSRMGQDKATLVRNKNSAMSMLSFSKQILKESGLNNIVVSGDNYDIPDTVSKSGPVGGILSVLAKFPQAKSLMILPVDLPFMTAQALSELRLKGQLSQKAAYFDDHSIPLFLPNNAYLEIFLTQAYNLPHRGGKKNGPSIKSLLSHVPNMAVKSSDATTLFNTNTPEQWQQAKQKLNA